MSPLMDLLSGDFLPKFLAGMVVNFEIAAIALGIGLALGLLLAAGPSAVAWQRPSPSRSSR